ncbi:MAG: cytochrome b/b6 domain-containing protein [Candidatus Promineifilaceae bacterium]|nr:cytochrome b/b6 domain-containing protein [Candidatus Promineifilaceae bacterium]
MNTNRVLLQKRIMVFATILTVAVTLLSAFFVTYSTARAQDNPPLHPTFPFLDEAGRNVLDTGQPLSTMNTCGQCHDTEFISTHSFHADVGLQNFQVPGEPVGGQPWDTSSGLFGKWNPMTYRYLSPQGDKRVDLTTADWLKLMGNRHVGGGPAAISRSGNSLLELLPDKSDVQSSATDPETGQPLPWDWQESGVVEMNCFLCHWPKPNNAERIESLRAGDFRWANSATLEGTGIIKKDEDQWVWDETAFGATGELLPERVKVEDPTNENCGLCHGLVHIDPQTPTVLEGCTAEQWSTITTGQIMSPQKINQSGLNVENKIELDRSWDVHTERVVGCTDCHYALNNPIYYQETESTRPDHLIFDPRRIDLGEYLYRPLHQFAKGQSAEGSLAPQFNNTLRRCEGCHETTDTHQWLPYSDQHLGALSCESCHIPKMFAPARQSMDWTVIHEDGTPASECRGVEGDGPTMASVLITGFEPVLLQRVDAAGDMKLAPHNLVSSWFWVYGDPERPVPQRDLQMAWLKDDQSYHQDIVNLFDSNKNGQIDDPELLIDSKDKEGLIAKRLEVLGLEDPRIQAEIRPYSINHNVTHGEWATQECSACHGENSRLAAGMLLSDSPPGGVMPQFVNNGTLAINGEMIVDETGRLHFQPQTELANLYVLGHNSKRLVDLLGALLFVGTLVGVLLHAGMRIVSARRNPAMHPDLREVYMYSFYERLWHWLQTAVIFILLFTGLIIHKPDIFGIFSFSYVVQVHNVMAAILIANAALALFYNLASGEIKQYIPQPRGFFSQAFSQAKYYLVGIFKGDDHPFEKTLARKMNPLQQITYLGLLNVLLPLQIITGSLMWGAQQWPQIALQLGGLPFLAPFHTLISWLLASFIVLHVYLTTTGPTPTANIEAMIMGWDEVEIHGQMSDRSVPSAGTITTD